MKLTPWFILGQNPVHIGIYERSWPDGKAFICPFYKWNGEKWVGSGNKNLCDPINEDIESIFQDVPWRGLAEDPSKAKK